MLTWPCAPACVADRGALSSHSFCSSGRRSGAASIHAGAAGLRWSSGKNWRLCASLIAMPDRHSGTTGSWRRSTSMLIGVTGSPTSTRAPFAAERSAACPVPHSSTDSAAPVNTVLKRFIRNSSCGRSDLARVPCRRPSTGAVRADGASVTVVVLVLLVRGLAAQRRECAPAQQADLTAPAFHGDVRVVVADGRARALVRFLVREALDVEREFGGEH